MILKEKKLSIVMALILGTTMLSSVEKAWGMDDKNDLIRKGVARPSSSASSSTSSSTSSIFDEKSLTGDLLVKGTYVRLNKHFVTALHGLTERFNAQPDLQKVVKGHLNTLLRGNFAGVASIVRATFQRPKTAEVFKASLRVILDDSQDDPYDKLILARLAKNNELYSPSAEEVADLKKLFESVSRDQLAKFLTSDLKYVIEEVPGIVESLLAHFPKTADEKILEGRASQSLVSFFIPDREKKSFVIDKIDDEQCLASFLERYSLLKQIEQIEESLRVAPSTSDPLVPSSSDAAPSMPSVKATFRTAGANPNARIKHSAVAIQLPNQELQDDAYELVVNHRTRAEGPMVRIYDPKAQDYNNLDVLPTSQEFCDTIFNVTPWAMKIRDDSSLGTQVATYLSFLNGKSDIHSFKIQSRGKVLKEIIFGDPTSESQPGIHVYGPEKSGDANEWSVMESEDLSE